MHSFVVIETDDLFQYTPACGRSGGVILVVDQFFFDDAVKRFDTCVVVAVAFTGLILVVMPLACSKA